MTSETIEGRSRRLLSALSQEGADQRLRAALAAGTHPDPAFVDPLILRSAEEPDFFVRDMLTWALVRHPAAEVLPRLRAELESPNPRARSQSLHTLSKFGEPHTRAWITGDHLHDPDDEVARTAWRAAVGLAAGDERERLGEELLAELGRGDREVQRSLSRALVELGEVVEPHLRRMASHPEKRLRAHAEATLRLFEDPESGFFLD